MIKKVTAILLFIIGLAVCMFTACTPKEEAALPNSTMTYIDYIDSGKTFTAQIGDVYGSVAKDIFHAADVQEFTFAPDMLEAVRMGKVDAAILDDAYVKQIQDSGQYSDLDYLPVPKEIFVNRASNVFYTEELRDEFNEWFTIIESDGTFDEIYKRWIGVSLPDEKDIPRFELTGENGTLRVCNTGSFPPFSYADSNNNPVGFDEEIICRFAEHLGMNIEYNMMAYDAIIPFVLSGKADMSACSFTVTDERSESMIFGNPYTKAHAVLVVPKNKTAANTTSAVKDHTSFAGKDIAVITGALTYNTTKLISGNPIEYNDSASAAEDVRRGRIAGYMHALTAVQVMASQMEGFEVIPIPKEIFSAQVAGISNDQTVIDRFNIFLADIEADGTLAEMQSRWFSDALNLNAPIPRIENSGENGMVKIAICSDSIPYVYAGANGDYSGFSTELALRFGAYEGKAVEFADMEFGGLIPYIISGKAELGLANMAVTEERKQSVLFTDTFFDEGHGILTLSETNKPTDNLSVSHTYAYYTGKDLGAIVGATHDMTIEKIGANPVYYNSSAEAAENVRQGRVEGFMTILSNARVMASQLDGFEVIPVPPEFFSGQVAGISSEQAVIDRFNVFLAAIRADGTFDEMHDRWFSDDIDLDMPMPEIENSGENGVLRVATSALSLPFAYVGSNGELKGYSIEIALRFGAYEGKIVEFAEMEFSALIPYINSGRAEISLASMNITEERKKNVLFTDSFHDEQHGILVLKQYEETNERSDDGISFSDFFGKTLGIPTGYVLDTMIENDFDGTVAFYSETSAGIEDVRQKRIAGFMTDLSVAEVIVHQQGNDDLTAVPVPEELFAGPLGAIAIDQDMINRFNVFLEKLDADGTLANMQRYWIEENPGSDPPMPDIPLTGENGVLKAAIGGGSIPFCYIGTDGEIKGFCAELIRLFAAREGLRVEFTVMEFSTLISYISSGKADIGIDAITITEERKKSVLFTEPFYYDLIGIIALKPNGTVTDSEHAIAKRGGFIAWLETGIERNLITDNRWKMIAGGLGVTMTIAVLSQIFGTVFGCFICWLLTRKNKFVNRIGSIYCGLIHGTPIVVLLMITYYIIFGSTDISNVLIAVAAFSIITGANVAGNLKGAIETIDPVEIEAARSIGFSAFKAFRTVTLPQAVRRALPGYTNGFVELVKATAIVGYIAIQDLTRAGDIIRSRTYDAYFPLLFVALIYLMVTTICVQLFKFIVKKINGGNVQ